MERALCRISIYDFPPKVLGNKTSYSVGYTKHLVVVNCQRLHYSCAFDETLICENLAESKNTTLCVYISRFFPYWHVLCFIRSRKEDSKMKNKKSGFLAPALLVMGFLAAGCSGSVSQRGPIRGEANIESNSSSSSSQTQQNPSQRDRSSSTSGSGAYSGSGSTSGSGSASGSVSGTRE